MVTCESSRFTTCESSRLVSLYFPRLPISPFSLSDFIIFPTSQFAAAIEDDGIISDKLPCGLGKIGSTCSSLLGSIFLKYFNNVILRNSELYFRNLTEISKFLKLNSTENYPLYGISTCILARAMKLLLQALRQYIILLKSS